MEERRRVPRPPASKGAKLIIAGVDSAIDCLVHDLSESGACLQVARPANLPPVFDLQVEGEGSPRACRMAWQCEDRIGVAFRRKLGRLGRSEGNGSPLLHRIGWRRRSSNRAASEWARGQLQALQCALDEIAVGVVLLDSELRAQFVNRAFRKMWQLTDEKAEAKPAFIALMYHGRDIGAYEVPKKDFPAYLAERVAAVKAGDTTPRDLRLADGRMVRFQCAVLPNGGRMLSYTPLPDGGQVIGPVAATVDGQTGVTNRRQFIALAEAEFERQPSPGSPRSATKTGVAPMYSVG
jgi:PAS domain-containing protein